MSNTPKPPPPPKRVAIGCAIYLFAAVMIFFAVRSCLGDEPEQAVESTTEAPTSTPVTFRNEGPESAFTLGYIAQLPGEPPLATGILIKERRVKQGEWLEGAVEHVFPAGTVFTVLAQSRSMGLDLDHVPLEIIVSEPAAPISFTYGFDAVEGQMRLRAR